MLKDFEEALETCTYCPNLCLHACPVANAEKKSSVTPWAKMSLVQWVRQGLAPMNGESVDMFYKCTGCSACTSACVHGVEVGEVLFAARAEAQSRGISGPGLEARAVPMEPLEAIRGESTLKSLRGKRVYWPGCRQAVGDHETLEDTLKVLQALTGEPVSLGPATCCGEAEVSNGRPGVGNNDAVALGYILAEAEQVFVGVGACQAHLSGARVMVESVVPFLLKSFLANPDLVKGTVPGKVAIFEGCHHVREMGMSDQVVALASRFAEGGVVELRWCGTSSHCCGAGGAYPQTSPDESRKAGGRILEMAKDSGAELLISFDAECVAHLKSSPLPEGIRVLSAMSVIAEMMGLNKESEGDEEEV